MPPKSRTQPLTDRQIAVLEFERLEFRSPAQRDGWAHAAGVGVVPTKDRWMHATGKAPVIRQLFGLSETAYYAVLLGLLDNPAAELYDAQLVRQLRRGLDARRGRR